MLIALFIMSLLTLIYFVVAKAINKTADAKLAAWEKSNQSLRKPVVVKVPVANLMGFIAGAILIGVIFFWSFIVNIEPQQVGVVKTPGGVKEVPLQTGWHFNWPWNEVYPMDKTIWVYTFSNKSNEGNKANADAIWAPTSEGIKMGFDLSVSWSIDPDYASWIYQHVSDADGGEYGRYKWVEDNIIRTRTSAAFQSSTVKYTPIQCYASAREFIKNDVTRELKKELEKLHFVLEQVDIREVHYDPGYEAELKNKKIQEQKALTLLEVTKQKEELFKQSKIDKDITIQSAQGEAEALRIKSQAIAQNRDILQLKWIEKWDGSLPTYMLGGGQNSMLMINPGK